MKCLSLRQPYAELLVTGRKTIELRNWNTKFRGEFLIHASKKVDMVACERLKIDHQSLTRGAIIGKAILIGVKTYHDSKSFIQEKNKHFAAADYSGSKYGFLVKNARRFKKPIVIAGKLGFFNVEF
jgi:predicted transcriptional regulator